MTWISTKDRLPQIDEYVFVHICCEVLKNLRHEYDIGYLQKDVLGLKEENYCIWSLSDFGQAHLHDIDFWMEIPGIEGQKI